VVWKHCFFTSFAFAITSLRENHSGMETTLGGKCWAYYGYGLRENHSGMETKKAG